LLRKALERLAGARIPTNIVTRGGRGPKRLGLLAGWGVIAEAAGGIGTWRGEVKLADWLSRAIASLEVLTLPRDYFRLDGGIERRLYELCRKHCGHQTTWSIGLDLLYKKSGSRAPLRNFRLAIKKLAESNHLPDYRLRFTPEDDKLTAYLRSHKGGLREYKDVLGIR